MRTNILEKTVYKTKNRTVGLVDSFSDFIGRTLDFKVYKDQNSEPYWRKLISLGYENKTKPRKELIQAILDSIKENIIPIDPDNLPNSNNYCENYGMMNTWVSADKNKRVNLLRYLDDLKRDPNLCSYIVRVRIGPCQTKVINYTYKYIYSYDSSD